MACRPITATCRAAVLLTIVAAVIAPAAARAQFGACPLSQNYCATPSASNAPIRSATCSPAFDSPGSAQAAYNLPAGTTSVSASGGGTGQLTAVDAFRVDGVAAGTPLVFHALLTVSGVLTNYTSGSATVTATMTDGGTNSVSASATARPTSPQVALATLLDLTIHRNAGEEFRISIGAVATAHGTASLTTALQITGLPPGAQLTSCQGFTNPPTGTLLGEMTTYAAGAGAHAVVVGDWNGDGIADLALPDYLGNSVTTMLGRGDGTFLPGTAISTGSGAYAVAAGYLNNDSRLDLAVANYGSNNVTVLRGGAGGAFQVSGSYAAGTSPAGIAIGDLNGDGKDDLAVANVGSNNASILPGLGDGTFGPKTDLSMGGSPFCIALADLNADGKTDLVVGNINRSTVTVRLGQGAGLFGAPETLATSAGPAFVAISDLDADGDLDLAVANRDTGTVSILLGNGDGTFGASTPYASGQGPNGLAVADFDGDGKPDIAVANVAGNNLAILIGRGDGSFAGGLPYPTSGAPLSVAAGDLNGDHLPDVAVAAYAANAACVLLNIHPGGPTAALLSMFDAQWVGDGVEVRWQYGPAVRPSDTVVERSSEPIGPWEIVSPGSATTGETGELLDRDVVTGTRYFYRLQATMLDGSATTFGPVEVAGRTRAPGFELMSPVPNPCRGQARIVFTLPHEARVRLSVLDVLGRRTTALADGLFRSGRYEVAWSPARIASTSSPGLYFVRFEWPGGAKVRRLIFTP